MRTIISNAGDVTFLLRGYRVPASAIDKFDIRNHTISNPYETDITCKIGSDTEGMETFKIVDGVTGWEQWNLKTLLKDDRGGDFIACAGTYRRYDRLVIYGHEWLAFVAMYKDTLLNREAARKPEIKPDLTEAIKLIGEAGVNAQDAVRSLKRAMRLMPDECVKLLDQEMKRRGLK